MRVSGGESRGRALKAPKHKGIRPTSDKAREALFSILADRVEGATFLELFAGTGAVGIDALSRGAEKAVFVDESGKAVRLIKENLEGLGYRGRAAVVGKDCLHFLSKTASELGPYDIVYVDPPYHEGTGERTMKALGSSGDEGGESFLASGAVVVYEHFKKPAAPERYGRLLKKKDYTYGDTVLSLYVLAGPEDGESGEG